MSPYTIVPYKRANIHTNMQEASQEAWCCGMCVVDNLIDVHRHQMYNVMCVFLLSYKYSRPLTYPNTICGGTDSCSDIRKVGHENQSRL